MSHVNSCDVVLVLCQSLFNLLEVRELENVECAVYNRNSVVLSTLHSSVIVETIVDNHDLLSVRNKRSNCNVDTDRTGTCKQCCNIVALLSVNDLNQIFCNFSCDSCERSLSVADIILNQGSLNCWCCC